MEEGVLLGTTYGWIDRTFTKGCAVGFVGPDEGETNGRREGWEDGMETISTTLYAIKSWQLARYGVQ